jgi:hypothetical protein
LGTSDLNYFTLRQLLSVSSSSVYLSILYPEELPTANCQLPTANCQQPTANSQQQQQQWILILILVAFINNE